VTVKNRAATQLSTSQLLPQADIAPAAPSLRIKAVWALPDMMTELGLDLASVLEDSGLPADLFASDEQRITYPQLERLLLACERKTGCDYFGMLVAQYTRLADLGLAGRVALCEATAGNGLRSLVDHFNLHDTAATVSLIEGEPVTRFIYAISEHGLEDTRHFQLGGITIAYNILQGMFGPDWVPTAVRFASRSPSNLRPFQKIFRAPLEFNADESAILFAPHLLERQLPPMDPSVRASIVEEVRGQRAQVMADLPATLRRILRKRLILDAFSMDEVAAQLSMHRRTLDRRLQRYGTSYGELLESVREDVARQLLRDTQMPIQRIAESVRFSSAANFATAFRRRAGMTPTEYRRRAS